MRIVQTMTGYYYKDYTLCRAFYYLFHYFNNKTVLFCFLSNDILTTNYNSCFYPRHFEMQLAPPYMFPLVSLPMKLACLRDLW